MLLLSELHTREVSTAGACTCGAGFERAWSAGAELGVLYGITFGGARKAKIFSGARAEAALATRFLGEVREKNG